MGTRFLPRAGYAVIIGAALAMPQAAFAYDPTNNPVADAVLASLEAGGAENAAVEDVAVSGDQIVLRGLTADLKKDGEEGSLSAASLAFSNAFVAPDGSVSAAALAATDVKIVQDEDTIEFAALALTDMRMPGPAEVKNPVEALDKKPAYKMLEITGISLQSAGEAAVPVERITSTFDPIGTDGSVKATFSVEKITLNPEAVKDDDFRQKMKTLGYDSVQIDMKAEGEWSAAEGRAQLHDFEISGQDMGTFQLSATILGVTPEVIEKLKAAQEDFGKTMELLQQLSISDLRVHFKNDSVVERVLDQQAKDANTDRAGLVDQLSSSLPGILSLMRNPAFQEKVATAVTTFLEEPGTLTASAHPAQPVPVAQIVGVAMIAPQTIPDVLSVDVTANQ
ncbi:hypothetical protein C8N35_10441 [Breoghania corrubedonensis]|uniref:DUF945 domain-containing protein n=2 Tax=Breoghania corrubedonensis TaxID=665038 RepID=A0A2T5V9J6_9HYPH|nr:hypothetical protein C8N35_10441 [Breoghania corrubedonensis]